MCLAKRDGTGPDVSSKFLSSCPKGLVWRTFFSPQASQRFHISSILWGFCFFFLEGGIWSGCRACVCAHTWVCCVCVSPPHSPMHFVPLASFAGELCVTLVFRQHRRGHAIYAPLPPSSASRCTLLPPFFLSPSLPSLLFVGCSTALTRSTGNK